MLILGFIKLKEFHNARTKSHDLINKLLSEKKEVPFGLEYMFTVARYQDSNARNKNKTLIELYRL